MYWTWAKWQINVRTANYPYTCGAYNIEYDQTQSLCNEIN